SAPAIATGEQTIASRRADGRWGVRIKELHSLRSQAVDMRRRNFRLRVVAGDVAKPQVVGKHHYDVRRGVWPRGVGQAVGAAGPKRRDEDEDEKAWLHGLDVRPPEKAVFVAVNLGRGLGRAPPRAWRPEGP